MKKRLFTFLFVSILALTACNGNKDSKSVDSEEISLTVDEVKSIYSENCSMCHGAILADGKPADFKSIGANLSREEINQIIREGKGYMDGGLVKDAEAYAISDWLSSMK